MAASKANSKGLNEMAKYKLLEQGFAFNTVEAEDAESALADVEPNYSDYASGDDDIGTVFVELAAVNVDDENDSASRSFTVEPDEPSCNAGEHDWQSPLDIVGGIKENPGVWGHGGGVTIDECCMHCGCRKFTDTWATNPSDGTQGHETVSYTLGFYSDELRARAEDQDDEATRRADYDLDAAKDDALTGDDD